MRPPTSSPGSRRPDAGGWVSGPDPRPACLLLDLDGTLLDIAPRPEAVRVPDGLVATLEAVGRRLEGALALVSGRPIGELDRLLAPLRTAAAGVHGAELRRRPGGPIERQPAPAALERARALLATAELPVGVLVEDKEVALAIHWRTAPEPPQALLDRLRALVAEAAGALEAVPGKAVLELRAAGLDKGGAVRALLAAPPFAGRRPVFVGDDTTDEDAFRAVERVGGVALPVGPAPPGGRPAVFAGPERVRAWLARIAAGGPILPVDERDGAEVKA